MGMKLTTDVKVSVSKVVKGLQGTERDGTFIGCNVSRAAVRDSRIIVEDLKVISK